jgi:hypothetical protein
MLIHRFDIGLQGTLDWASVGSAFLMLIAFGGAALATSLTAFRKYQVVVGRGVVSDNDE